MFGLSSNWLTWAIVVGVIAIFVGDAIYRWWQLNAWKRRWNGRGPDE